LYGYYDYMCVDPMPPTDTPLPAPDDFGVVYGQVSIGPLCPVEPCDSPASDVYSSRSLVIEPSNGGEQVKVELTPDGWFKWQLKPGTYTLTLTDCTFMGCDAALPVKVDVLLGQVSELRIDIDTGIR
jgi:hypothetical protein